MAAIHIACGAFADVFDLGDGRVLKAFRNVAPAQGDADATLVPRICFRAELVVYETLRDLQHLEKFTPAFFGASDPSTHLNALGPYPTGCGIILEKVDGALFSPGQLAGAIQAAVDDVLMEIQRSTPADHVWDASCFVPGSRADYTVIDFATPATLLAELDEVLAEHGTMPDHLLSHFGL